MVRDDRAGIKTLESYHSGTEVIELDYAAGSIGVDLGATVAVSRVELLPASPVHRVGTRHLSVWTSTGGTYERASDWYSRKKDGGIIEIVFLTPTNMRYLKVHCSFDERDIDLAAVNAVEFSNTAANILRVYTTSQVTSEDEFSYDGAGNRVGEILTQGGVPSSYTSLYYSGTHRLKANGRWGYQYDANGNLVRKGASYTVNGDEVIIDTQAGEWWEYSYDLANRLTGVSHNGVTVASYRYDPWGRRVRRTAGGGTTYFAFDQWGRAIYEKTGSGYRDHVYAFGEHLARVDGTVSGEVHTPGAKYFYHSDHIGTVEAMTDAGGAVVWQASYTAFGVVTAQSGSVAGPPIFTGKTLDEANGLYYFNARWYDPDVGRFMTEDPAEDGINWYVYARNNPATYTDPTGLSYSSDDQYDPASGSYDPPTYEPQQSEPQPVSNNPWMPTDSTGTRFSRWAEDGSSSKPSAAGTISQPIQNPEDVYPTTGSTGGYTPPQAPSPPGPKGSDGPEGNGNDNPEGGGGGGFEQGGTAPAGPTVTQILREVTEGIGHVPPARTSSQNDPRISDIPNMTLDGCYFRMLQAVAEFWVGRALREDERKKQIHTAVRKMRRAKVGEDGNGDVFALMPGMNVQGPDEVVEDALRALGYPSIRVSVGYRPTPPPPGVMLVATILKGKLP